MNPRFKILDKFCSETEGLSSNATKSMGRFCIASNSCRSELNMKILSSSYMEVTVSLACKELLINWSTGSTEAFPNLTNFF